MSILFARPGSNVEIRPCSMLPAPAWGRQPDGTGRHGRRRDVDLPGGSSTYSSGPLTVSETRPRQRRSERKTRAERRSRLVMVLGLAFEAQFLDRTALPDPAPDAAVSSGARIQRHLEGHALVLVVATQVRARLPRPGPFPRRCARRPEASGLVGPRVAPLENGDELAQGPVVAVGRNVTPAR